jgi:hypothetical protein
VSFALAITLHPNQLFSAAIAARWNNEMLEKNNCQYLYGYCRPQSHLLYLTRRPACFMMIADYGGL